VQQALLSLLQESGLSGNHIGEGAALGGVGPGGFLQPGVREILGQTALGSSQDLSPPSGIRLPEDPLADEIPFILGKQKGGVPFGGQGDPGKVHLFQRKEIFQMNSPIIG
jgi:hypothetical protein